MTIAEAIKLLAQCDIAITQDDMRTAEDFFRDALSVLDKVADQFDHANAKAPIGAKAPAPAPPRTASSIGNVVQFGRRDGVS